jgi:acetyltransferase-like isoleucine patch superfamily enzyme
MFKKLLSYIVKKLKKRPFKFDDSISNLDLLFIAFRFGLGLLKGLIRLRKMVILGKGVYLYAKKQLFIAKGVSIGDFVTIDGIGAEGITLGKATSIGAFSVLKVSGSLLSVGKGIAIGDNVGIGEFAHIGGAGGVKIGSDTIIGSYFSVHPENHIFSNIEQPIRLQGVTHQGISVGRGCWIGAKVTLLDGACIGDGCVVAAGAVVKGIFPNNVVIGGIPARVLKER